MHDPFEGYISGLNAPATKLIPITPNDALDLDIVVRGLCVASSGLVRVTTVDDTEATIFVVAGAPFPARVRRVWSNGTDATGIVGLV